MVGKSDDKSADPIRMYLREMGGVELLSREGEIAIAKRIEVGKDVMINGLFQSPITAKKVFEWKEKLEKGEDFYNTKNFWFKKEDGSIVKSQDLSAKLPGRMQMAAMYGANNAEKFGDGNIENYDDWGGAALGKAETDSEKRDPFDTASEQDALYDSLVSDLW